MLPDACIDMVLTDLPYGTTDGDWDIMLLSLSCGSNYIVSPNLVPPWYLQLHNHSQPS